MEKSASPEVLGCRLNSFPALEVNIKIFYKKVILLLQKTYLAVCHELVNEIQGQTFRSASKVHVYRPSTSLKTM